MCPDEEILSAYVDGELSARWKKQVEDHLRGCRHCSALVEGYQSLSTLLHEHDLDVTKDMHDRVFHDIIVRRRAVRAWPLWTRRVSLPVPLAAAAALFVVVVVVYLLAGGLPSSRSAIAVADEIIIPPENLEVRTLEEAIRVFESQNAHIEVYIQLPEEKNFQRVGEPLLIREADFKPGR